MTTQAALHRHLEIVASQAESLRNRIEDMREQIEVIRKWDNDLDADITRRERMLAIIHQLTKIQRESSVLLDWMLDVTIES